MRISIKSNFFGFMKPETIFDLPVPAQFLKSYLLSNLPVFATCEEGKGKKYQLPGSGLFLPLQYQLDFLQSRGIRMLAIEVFLKLIDRVQVQVYFLLNHLPQQ